MILCFRMAEVQFLRALAGYFGFPFLFTVAFALLLFWICRYFGQNALTQAPGPNPIMRQGHPVPNLNLRNVATATLLILLVPFGLSGRPPRAEASCDAKIVKRQFQKVLESIKACNEDVTGLSEFRKGLCDPVFDSPVQQVDPVSFWTSPNGFKILAVIGIILIVVMLACRYRNRRTPPTPTSRHADPTDRRQC